MTVRRAIAVFLVALALLRSPGGAAQQADVWQALAIEGVEALNRGDDATALDRFLRALDTARLFSPDDSRRINSLVNVAVAYRRLYRFDQAEIYYLEAIQLQELTGDPNIVMSLDALGQVYAARGFAGRAAELFRDAIARIERIAGPDHPFTAIVLEHLGDVLMHLGQYEEVGAIFGRVVAIREVTFGLTHRSLAPALTREGIAYMAVSRNLDAAQVLRRALAIWRSGGPPPPDELIATLEALVDVSQSLGRHRDAADYQRQVVVVRGVQEGERGDRFADELVEYVRLLRRAGDAREADAMAVQAALARERGVPRP